MRIHPEAERELEELALDATDLDLLEHVLGDDRPPQGLRRGGFKPTLEEEGWEDEWRYGDGLDDVLRTEPSLARRGMADTASSVADAIDVPWKASVRDFVRHRMRVRP